MDYFAGLEDVTVVNEQFYRALENCDLFAMSDIWLQQDWVKCVHPGWDMIIGWENIRASWEKIFDNTSGMRVSATDIRVTVDARLALVTCHENLALFLDSSSAPISAQTLATNMFQQVDGKWLMIHHHASQIPNLSAGVTESDMIQ